MDENPNTTTTTAVTTSMNSAPSLKAMVSNLMMSSHPKEGQHMGRAKKQVLAPSSVALTTNTKYYGVRVRPGKTGVIKYEARYHQHGREHVVGLYMSELEAARAYDEAVLKACGLGPDVVSRLNFPLSDYFYVATPAPNQPTPAPNQPTPDQHVIQNKVTAVPALVGFNRDPRRAASSSGGGAITTHTHTQPPNTRTAITAMVHTHPPLPQHNTETVLTSPQSTGQLTIAQPTTAQPTTGQPTTAQHSTAQPTTAQPTTSHIPGQTLLDSQQAGPPSLPIPEIGIALQSQPLPQLEVVGVQEVVVWQPSVPPPKPPPGAFRLQRHMQGLQKYAQQRVCQPQTEGQAEEERQGAAGQGAAGQGMEGQGAAGQGMEGSLPQPQEHSHLPGADMCENMDDGACIVEQVQKQPTGAAGAAAGDEGTVVHASAAAGDGGTAVHVGDAEVLEPTAELFVELPKSVTDVSQHDVGDEGLQQPLQDRQLVQEQPLQHLDQLQVVGQLDQGQQVDDDEPRVVLVEPEPELKVIVLSQELSQELAEWQEQQQAVAMAAVPCGMVVGEEAGGVQAATAPAVGACGQAATAPVMAVGAAGGGGAGLLRMALLCTSKGGPGRPRKHPRQEGGKQITRPRALTQKQPASQPVNGLLPGNKKRSRSPSVRPVGPSLKDLVAQLMPAGPPLTLPLSPDNPHGHAHGDDLHAASHEGQPIQYQQQHQLLQQQKQQQKHQLLQQQKQQLLQQLLQQQQQHRARVSSAGGAADAACVVSRVVPYVAGPGTGQMQPKPLPEPVQHSEGGGGPARPALERHQQPTVDYLVRNRNVSNQPSAVPAHDGFCLIIPPGARKPRTKPPQRPTHMLQQPGNVPTGTVAFQGDRLPARRLTPPLDNHNPILLAQHQQQSPQQHSQQLKRQEQPPSPQQHQQQLRRQDLPPSRTITTHHQQQTKRQEQPSPQQQRLEDSGQKVPPGQIAPWAYKGNLPRMCDSTTSPAPKSNQVLASPAVLDLSKPVKDSPTLIQAAADRSIEDTADIQLVMHPVAQSNRSLQQQPRRHQPETDDGGRTGAHRSPATAVPNGMLRPGMMMPVLLPTAHPGAFVVGTMRRPGTMRQHMSPLRERQQQQHVMVGGAGGMGRVMVHGGGGFMVGVPQFAYIGVQGRPRGGGQQGQASKSQQATGEEKAAIGRGQDKAAGGARAQEQDQPQSRIYI